MTRTLFVVGLALASLGFARRTSQPKPEPYRVAFDLTSRDSLDQKAVLRWIREISAASPQVEIEVVMYGKGFELAMPERSPLAGEVRDAMKNNQVEKSQLVPGVQTVPDGIYELVSKQQQHWGYIKVTH